VRNECAAGRLSKITAAALPAAEARSAMIIPVVAMVVVMVIAMLVVTMVAMIVTMVAIVAAVEMIAMMFAIMRHIHTVVPVVPNEENRFTAGIVFVTVATPMSFITGRHVQIHGRRQLDAGGPKDNDWRRIEELRRGSVAQIDSTKKARFTDVDRHSDVRGGHDRTHRDEPGGPDSQD
jgi:hypothetical protein